MSMHVISWNEYISPQNSSFLIPHSSLPLAVTVGVFDGVHLGHQALIRRICTPPSKPVTQNPHSSFLIPHSLLPTVVTFKQNPINVLKPGSFSGDILTLDQKLHILESLGVQMTVLIDFSTEFSKINGRDFINLLLDNRPVKLVVLGVNFRCGCGLDTGAEEIRGIASAKGVETEVVRPVTDGGLPVSSSRIRELIAAGRTAEAEKLLGRPREAF